jgi:hypothetical protein
MMKHMAVLDQKFTDMNNKQDLILDGKNPMFLLETKIRGQV